MRKLAFALVAVSLAAPALARKVAGVEFADAMFRNWLGPSPADDDLKAAMLGRR